MERAGVGLSSPALHVPPGHLGMASEGDAGPLVVSGLRCTPAKSLLCVNKEIALFSLKG